MPKVSAKVLATKIEGGRLLAMLCFNGRLPPKGELVTVKFGKRRSNAQNNFYWEYLTFLWDDCNLKEDYLTIDDLHETLKASFLSKRLVGKNGTVIIKVGSTAELDKIAFGEYLERVDKAMVAYHGVSTAGFWADYEQNYKV